MTSARHMLGLVTARALFSSLVLFSSLALLPLAAHAQHADEHGEAAAHEGETADEHGDAAPHEGGAAGEHGEHGAVHEPEWDYTRLAGQLLNFGIWAALLIYVIRTRVPGYLAGRKAALVEGLEEARRMKDEAERKVDEYTARIDNLDAELERMREEMREGGLAERNRIVEDAAARAEKMRAEAKFLIQQQMKTLREELTREAIEAAIGAAEKILREKAAAPDQERLATEYLGHLERQLKAQPKESR